MRKVFWDNPYQSTLIMTVSSVNGNSILFEKTIIFFREGKKVIKHLLVESL